MFYLMADMAKLARRVKNLGMAQGALLTDSQWRLLYAINLHPDGYGKTFSEASGLDRTTTFSVLRRLSSAGLIIASKQNHKGMQGREVTAVLTEKGKKMLRHDTEVWGRVFRELMAETPDTSMAARRWLSLASTSGEEEDGAKSIMMVRHILSRGREHDGAAAKADLGEIPGDSGEMGGAELEGVAPGGKQNGVPLAKEKGSRRHAGQPRGDGR